MFLISRRIFIAFTFILTLFFFFFFRKIVILLATIFSFFVFFFLRKFKFNFNLNWPQTPDHPCRILKVGGSGSGKTNALLNLISNQLDIDKIYFYAKDLCGAKYQLLISKRENTGFKYLNDSKAFIEYSNDMDDKSIEE